MKKSIVAYLLAVLATYVVAVILVSQFNIHRVIEMGYAITFAQRLEAGLHDLLGMVNIYLPVIALGMLIGLAFTGLLLLRFIRSPLVLYPLAGFAALIAIHLILQSVLGLTGIAPTRTLLGLLSQGFAGALGGYVFYRIRYSDASS